MSEDDGARSRREALYNLDRILDVHTHLTGMEGESAESILKCMDFCGIDKVLPAKLRSDCLVFARSTRCPPSPTVTSAVR
jgi:hypothetical protein